MKYAKYIIGWFIAGLVLSYGLSVAATTLQGFQGGTGYATTSASNMGNFLQVASTSPYLTYTFGTSTGGTGTLSGNGTPTQVAFYTALQTLSSSLNLFWDNINSRLGIGTSTPQFPLHVMGDIKSTGSSTAEHFILGGFAPDSIYPATDPNSSISWTGPDVMQLTTGGTARITINAAGNVGVGTTTPATTLDINGNVSERGYNDFYAISNPAAPAAGISRTHALTTQGVTRVEVDNECSMNNTINRDNYFVAKNVSGSSMATGTPAYRSGNTGAVPNVDRANANSTTTLPAIGVSEGTIANNAFGCFINYGILSPVDTSALSAGDIFVSPVASGTLTNTRPTVPNSVQRIGSVLSAGVGNGSLLITIAPAAQGMETGTIQSSFNINGSNAITTSSVNQFALVGATATNNLLSVSSSSGVLSLTPTSTPSFTSVTYPDSTKTSTGYKDFSVNILNTSSTTPVGASSTIQKMYLTGMTLTLISCSTDGSSITLQSDYRASSTPQTYGTSTFTGLVCSSTGASTTTFSNANIPAGSVLNFWPSSVPNSTTTLRIYGRAKEI